MKRILEAFWYIFLLSSLHLYADISYTYRPWTRSFLESKLLLSAERTSTSSRDGSLTQGELFLSTAPFPDWQLDLGVAGNALSTGKVALRVEKSIFSDLLGKPYALSSFIGCSAARERRVNNPLFFEMDQHAVESGLSFGKHLFIQKDSYIQAFSNILSGVGSRGFWAQGDAGLYYSFLAKPCFAGGSIPTCHLLGIMIGFVG